MQNNHRKVGRNIYQKPRLKQDKGGGIISTAELARFCPYKQQATRLQNAAPLLALSVPRSLSTRGKPAFGVKGKVERNLAQPLATRP